MTKTYRSSIFARMKKILGVLFLILTSSLLIAATYQTDMDFSWDQESIKAEAGGHVKTAIGISLPEDYFIYSDKTDLEFLTLERIRVTKVTYPKPLPKQDPMGGKPSEVYISGSEIVVEMDVPKDMQDGVYEVSALLHYQGCSDKICLKPGDKLIRWKIAVGKGGAAETAAETEQRSSSPSWISRLATTVRNINLENVLNVSPNLLFLIALIGGILSSFTPCILPLIPITLLIIGVHPKKKWTGNLALSAVLVFGMSVTYSVLGLIAAAAGLSVGFIFQSRLFLAFVVIFFFLMSFSLLGFYHFRLPHSVSKVLTKLGGSGYRGAFLAGISMGFLATPCVGPVLASLLVVAASTKNILQGFLLLLTYSIGLGAVIMIIGTWYGTVMGHVKKVKVGWIKKFIGLLMLIPALYYLNSFVPLSCFFNPKSPITWSHSYEVLNHKEARPKMVIFTAEWCPPCKILEGFALKDPAIVKLAEKFISVKVDTTVKDEKNDLLIAKYGVMGWPTVVFISPAGEAWNDLKISGGLITADALKAKMEEALKRSE